MKILVIGSGAREHAIVWKLRQSTAVEKVWCAPGNGGISDEVECLPLDVGNVNAAAKLAEDLHADLTVVGPELPLVLGIADEFARRGLTLLGPSRDAAQLEGSKIFTKEFLERHGIPTAAVYGIHDSLQAAQRGLASVSWPVVIKADGLCAGKGVLVTSDRSEASSFVERLMSSGEFGDAGSRVMFEEALQGDEISYIILTDGTNFIPMAPTRDHKRAFDNDRGPNTGGMGAYSNDSLLPAAVEKQILDAVVRPTLAGLQKDGLEYRGFLYFGLMLTSEGPKVLEFNCRLGDPETEVIMPRADFDPAAACLETAHGKLTLRASWSSDTSVCVVLASEGYPTKPLTGREIYGLEEAAAIPGTMVFHAGTKKEGSRYITTGGRVLVVSAKGDSIEQARALAYEAISKIKIAGAHYRTDIGARHVAKEQAAVPARNG